VTAFTDEQAQAIARREGPLLLSAAAGSGKTTVLVERFVRMVTDDGIQPARILVITFTDKAAGELRARIRRALLDQGRRELAQDAEAAWITTFHGFCARVLRAHAVAAGLDPRFAVLDEAAGRELRDRAFDDAVAGLLGRPEDPPRHDALDLVSAYTLDRLKTAVLDLYGQLRSSGQERPSLPAPAAGPDLAPLRDALAERRDAAAAALAGESGKTVADAQAALERCLAVVGFEGDPPLSLLASAAFKPGNTGVLKAEPCASYLAAHAAYDAALTEALAARAVVLIDELLARYADAYDAAKTARSAVDFDDLELKASALFDASTGLAAAWAGRFERIMVDEFQDTNAVQVRLLERLDAGHTFRVGDELQSIYGFRHARVELFRKVHDELDRDGAAALLTTNFRSRPEVIEWVNRAAASLHPNARPLVAGRDAAGRPVSVELLVTDARNGNWDAGADGAPGKVSPWRWAEAQLLAQRIAELIADGEKARDIVVLVRAATDIACYEHAIEAHGISTLSAGGRGFWARQQVQDLTQYLATLANPRDEPALLGVLASPLGPALSSDALALLAIAAREHKIGLWQAIEEARAELPAADAARLAAWRERFAAERLQAPRLTLADILTRAIAAAGYDEHVLRLPGGVRRLANVRKLIRLAATYERESGRGVRGFIDRATAELEAEARESDAPVELAGEDAVRLMTIHAAKGLEFPIVALADLGRAPNYSQPDVIVDGDRIGLRVVSLEGDAKTAMFEELAAERRARDEEEARRVFHVAMTRAEERLILSGALNVEKWPAATPLGWLGPALLPDIGARLLADGPVIEEDGLRATLSTPDNGILRPPPEPDANSGRQNAAYSPLLSPAAVVPAPVAVSTLSYSALSRYAQCGYRFYLERVLRLPEQDAPPNTSAPAGGLDPLTRGSVAHELLERLDLLHPQVPSPEEIANAAKRHDAAPTDADIADITTLVEGAIGSDTLRRIRDARERHVEESFALAVGDLPLFTGFIDVRAVEADGTHLIVDYKSDRLDGAEPEPLVEQDYGVQRRLYALAALRAGAQRVEVVHLFLEQPANPATATCSLADIEPIEGYLGERAAGIVRGEFAVAEHPHLTLCATCPGRGGLCSWPEERVLVPLAES